MTGPEITAVNHLKQFNKKANFNVHFYKGPVGEFFDETDKKFEVENTLCVGYNPGYGSGF
jgi:capsule polysaccharide modification protein KpsS